MHGQEPFRMVSPHVSRTLQFAEHTLDITVGGNTTLGEMAWGSGISQKP